MPVGCPECGRKFHRDAGYFLGSIYFNYGVTGLLVVILYFSMFFADILSNPQRLVVLLLLAVLFPMWFFRYARALWMAADEYLDPWPNEEERRSNPQSSADTSGKIANRSTNSLSH
jgi:hypothetical protein